MIVKKKYQEKFQPLTYPRLLHDVRFRRSFIGLSLINCDIFSNSQSYKYFLQKLKNSSKKEKLSWCQIFLFYFCCDITFFISYSWANQTRSKNVTAHWHQIFCEHTHHALHRGKYFNSHIPKKIFFSNFERFSWIFRDFFVTYDFLMIHLQTIMGSKFETSQNGSRSSSFFHDFENNRSSF